MNTLEKMKDQLSGSPELLAFLNEAEEDGYFDGNGNLKDEIIEDTKAFEPFIDYYIHKQKQNHRSK